MRTTRPKRLEQGVHLRRRALATVWLIMSMPVLLAALCLTIDIGKLWGERAALENAVEAAALAAVRYWQDQGAKLDDPDILKRARQEGIAFGQANLVDGMAADLSGSGSGGAEVYFEFGCILDGSFRGGGDPECPARPPAVRIRVLKYPISSACGMNWPYHVNVETVAAANCGASDPVRLVPSTR